MRKSNLVKKIMATALSMALILGVSPGPVFAENPGGTFIADNFDGFARADIYYAEKATAQIHDLAPGENSRDGYQPAPRSETRSQGVFSQFSPLNSQNYAEDRVIVKLAASGGDMLAAGAAGTQQNSLFPSDLGVSFTDIRMLNPSMESGNTGGFFINTVQAPSQTQTFNSQLLTFNSDSSAQNNIFVLILEETGGDAVQNALAILNANPAIEIAEPDFLYELAVTPNDPMFNAQYALEKINAERAWDVTTGARNVVVGVIDTGIDGMHPDLTENLWENPNPGQNGYVNDIYGYNFTGRVGGVPTDTNGHGTHVAGIIGAKGNNGIGVSGVNWDVSLAWLGIHEFGTYVSVSAAIEAINYAHNHNIPILNASWGSHAYSETLKETISNYDGLFVAAAGNDGTDNDIWPHYPSGYNLPNVISVASTDAWDDLSFFSSYGADSVHIAAPGDEILSVWLNGSYTEMSGTSMASPHVAGVAALIKAVNPDYPPELVREVLAATSRPMAEGMFGPSYSFGIVDADAALLFDISGLFAVTFDFQDDVLAPVVVNVAPGGRLREPVEPVRAGYAFDGWHTQADGGVLYDFSDTVNGDMTLYARWFIPAPGMYYWEFPDLNFQREVLRLLNMQDGGQRARSDVVADDGVLLASLTSLDVNGRSILDITGLGYFTGLTWLDCSQNRLTELDISKNTELTRLDCSQNRLTELNISRNAELTWLDCSDNELAELDVTNNTGLMGLNVGYNQMASIDSVTGWREIGLDLDFGFIFYPQKKAFTDLQNEIAAYRDAAEDMVITISADIPMTSSLIIPGNRNGKTLTITGDNAARAITRSRSNIAIIVVNADASVILENVTIDGNKDVYPDNLSPLVYVSHGGLTMEDGAVLANNGGYMFNGGGVHIDGGTLVMNGGKIIGNTASHGGGVFIRKGIFTMNGGDIGDNAAIDFFGNGGAVYAENGSFIMNGGTISGNTAFWEGGGVYVTATGVFIMNGGKIGGNTATSTGGGVHAANNSTFTMQDGEITGNTATGAGGGVYAAISYGAGAVEYGGAFILGGTAVISNNTNSNVYLEGRSYYNGSYITLGDGPGGNGVAAPAPGMEVWVTKIGDGDVIVRSGASPAHTEYFFADEYDGRVTYEDGGLVILYGHGLCIFGYCLDGPSDITIPFDQDLTQISPVTIPPRTTLTLKSVNAAGPVTLTRGVDGNLFTVRSGAKLILEDIVIDGNKDAFPDNESSLVHVVGGEFIMKDGAVLTNNGGNTYYSDGGVSVSSGEFTMLGGKIIGNTALFGGGVLVSPSGKFIMFGGEISGNIAQVGGGVYIDAYRYDDMVNECEFVIFDGIISGNTAEWGYGGGVYLSGGTFTMLGGEISGNSAELGGGVLLDFNYEEFILGGTAVISGNTNNNVYLEDGYFITLSTGTPPAAGMYVGVWTEAPDGVIVESGASPGDAAYFFADEYGMEIRYKDGQLRKVMASAIIYGDVDGDGRVTPLDSTILARWLAGSGDTVINEEAADVNGDGMVTPLDQTILRRHLARWVGYETLPYQSPPPAPLFMSAASPLMSGVQPAVPAINISGASGNVGDIVDVNIGLSDNPGIIAMRLGVEFDSAVLRLVGVTDNGKLGEKYHRNVYDASPHRLFWENGVSRTDFGYSGEVATLRFEILSETAGSPVTVNYDGAGGDVFDFNLRPVHFEVNGGTVSTLPVNDVTLVGAVPSASVKVLNGNRNDLTVAVTETYSDGSKKTIKEVFSINNNAAGTYRVGEYVVYVETRGNDQIRQCYFK